MPRKVILDVDTGSDDAVAIITALLAPELEVLGICSVNGNREVRLTTENTLRVVELLGADVPVYQGCEFPLVSTLLPWRRPEIPIREGELKGTISKVHGDYLPFPPATRKPEDKSAVVYLIETLLASDGDITLVPVGPLTNIAAAMRADPRILPKIKEIMIMGAGYCVNNKTPMAEYNFWVDPEAAEIVLQCGRPITLVPLDAPHQAYLTVEDAARMRTIGNKAADAVAALIEQRTSGYDDDADMHEYKGAPIHDALAVCALLDESVLKDVREVNAHVDISGGFADGQTCIDMRQTVLKDKPNCRIALGADRHKFADILVDVLHHG